MAQVQTVTGPIDADQLGTTLIHEHLRNSDEAVHEQWPQTGAVKEEFYAERPSRKSFTSRATAIARVGYVGTGHDLGLFSATRQIFSRPFGYRMRPCMR